MSFWTWKERRRCLCSEASSLKKRHFQKKIWWQSFSARRIGLLKKVTSCEIATSY
jgi:hypothetical protein